MLRHYILGPDGEPILEPDFMKWADWFEKADRRVAYEDLGEVTVSTVFLGLDQRFTTKGETLRASACPRNRFFGVQHPRRFRPADAAAQYPLHQRKAGVHLHRSLRHQYQAMTTTKHERMPSPADRT